MGKNKTQQRIITEAGGKIASTGKKSTARQGSNNHIKASAGTILVFLWAASVLIRFLFAFIYRQGPTIIIDESLYTNIARSLAAGEGIAYRSQPIPYLYIFYPLLLTPIYMLPIDMDIYRVIQLWNAILMSTSVFPVYLLAKDLTRDEKKALICGAGTLLMPDLCMAGYLMSECVVWPLSLWMVWTAWKLFSQEDGKLKNGIMTGVLTALLFWTKPGSMAMGICLLLIILILGKRTKDKAAIKASFAGIGAAGALIGCFYLLYVFGFGYNMSVLGLYDKQLTETSLGWYAAVTETSVLQVLLFTIGCVGFIFVLPFTYYRELEEKQQKFLAAFSIGLAVTAIGTAAFVVMYKWNGSYTNMKLHLRYMSMYIPVMMAFFAAIPEQKQAGRGTIIVLAVMAVLIVFPGAGIGFVKGSTSNIDSMTLSAWSKNMDTGDWTGILAAVITAFFMLFLCGEISRAGLNQKLKRICAIFTGVFMIYNNVFAISAGKIEIETHALSDAREANRMVEEADETVLGVLQEHYNDIRGYWEETQLRRPMQQVTMDSMLLALEHNGGIYAPFVPTDQAPNRGNHSTPETNTFLLGETVAEHMELSPNTEVKKTSNGLYSLVRVAQGERLAESAIFGLDGNTLREGKTAYVDIYNPEKYAAGSIKLRLAITNENPDAILEVKVGEETKEVPLDVTGAIYDIIIPGRASTAVSVSGGEIDILGYRIEEAE